MNSTAHSLTPPASTATAPVAAPEKKAEINASLANLPAGLEKANITLALAQEITDADKNPFMNKLPQLNLIPISKEAPGAISPISSQPAAMAPLSSSLEGIALGGIIYHPGSPIALLQASGDSASSFVRVGDVVSSGGAQVRILNIQRDSVEVQDASSPKHRRRLYLQSVNRPEGSSSSKSGPRLTPEKAIPSLSPPPAANPSANLSNNESTPSFDLQEPQ